MLMYSTFKHLIAVVRNKIWVFSDTYSALKNHVSNARLKRYVTCNYVTFIILLKNNIRTIYLSFTIEKALC
jgi:hypothetical protein